jgi:hypothetical protein
MTKNKSKKPIPKPITLVYTEDKYPEPFEIKKKLPPIKKPLEDPITSIVCSNPPSYLDGTDPMKSKKSLGSIIIIELGKLLEGILPKKIKRLNRDIRYLLLIFNCLSFIFIILILILMVCQINI